MAGGYDNLNRLTAASSPTGAGGPYAGLQVSWSYDDFGNRTAESLSGNDQGTAPVPASASAGYNASNQMQSVGSGVAPTYDAAGNVLTDPQGQQYLYDAEGRVCAVNGLGGLIGYLYDAEGDRVAKGTLSSFSCNAASNGFQMTASYVLGPSGEQLTEVDWSGGALSNWHTNVWAAGELVGTYSPNFDPSQTAAGVLNFYLDDWLGTRRVMTDALGNGQESCNSLPYGDGETCAPVPTEHLFTGKERDAESGNDYFGARYYASSMGRFMSPDWSDDPNPVPYADYDNPQSLNLYSYGGNNPLANIDSNGHYHCDPDTSTTTTDSDGNTTVTVTAGACHYDWDDFVNFTSQIAQQTTDALSNAAHQTANYLAAPRDPGCMATMAGGGAAAGAFAGGALGGLGGGAGGTLVAPGVGTVGGAWAGAAAGATEGAGLGGAAGTAVGFFACASGESGSGGSGGNTVHGGERGAERGFTQAQIDEAKKTAEETGNVTTQMGKYGTPQKVYNGSNGLTVVEETQGRNAGKIITGWWR